METNPAVSELVGSIMTRCPGDDRANVLLAVQAGAREFGVDLGDMSGDDADVLWAFSVIWLARLP